MTWKLGLCSGLLIASRSSKSCQDEMATGWLKGCIWLSVALLVVKGNVTGKEDGSHDLGISFL